MSAFRNGAGALFAAVTLTATSSSLFAAAGYSFVEGYNVLDTNNAPVFASGSAGTNFAGTAGQERDIAVDEARGIIYLARGQNTINDRPGGVIGISAIVVTNGARAGSNFRDTGLITASGAPALSWCQSFAYDKTSDKLWVLGGGIGAVPNIYSAPGGTLGGAPNGDGIAFANSALVRAFQVSAGLADVISNGYPRGGQPRGFAVRTVADVTTLYLGMGNHVQAWSNDQPLVNPTTNSPWRRIWATLRPPAGNLVSTRVTTNFTGVNGVAVDDAGNCYFSVNTAGGRIWTIRPEIIQSSEDPMTLDFNDLALGGTRDDEILPVLITGSVNAPITNSPQALTFCRFNSQKVLFASFLSGGRAVTRLDVDDNVSYLGGNPYVRMVAVNGFGSGQPAGGQDSILSTMRLKATNAAPALTQPFGATQGLLYTDVGSITNPTHIYAAAFVTDTNKGQALPTAAIIKVALPLDTNAPSITAQPVSQTWFEGSTISLSVVAAGMQPLVYQWRTNGVDVSGATNPTFTILNAATNDSGAYRVVITNLMGSITSAVATVTVNPLVRSLAMTPLWSNAPGSRPYLTTDSTQRGITYNPTTLSVLIATRAPAPGVYVLDSETGADLYQLTLGPLVTGGTFPLSKISASDDGQIYAANLAQNGEAFRIYRWGVEEAAVPATLAFSGNPTPGVTNRWGDTFDVRGSGNDIQILVGTRSSNTVAIFRTTDDGGTFTSTPITVADAPGTSFGLGLAFGAGNTFWAKGDGSSPLRHVQFDLGTGTGTTLRSYPAANYVSSGLAIAIETNLNLLASISIENPDNLRLYTTFTTNPPVLIDQELFPTNNDNAFGTGALEFGGGKLFALDSNNGILAMTLGAVTQPPGSIAIVRNGPTVELSWSGLFTLQAATNVVGPYIDITSPTNSYSEITAGQPERYFKLRN